MVCKISGLFMPHLDWPDETVNQETFDAAIQTAYLWAIPRSFVLALPALPVGLLLEVFYPNEPWQATFLACGMAYLLVWFVTLLAPIIMAHRKIHQQWFRLHPRAKRVLDGRMGESVGIWVDVPEGMMVRNYTEDKIWRHEFVPKDSEP